MSAESNRSVQTQCGDGSRIPVASPSAGFRRCSSMRLRGERPCTLRIRAAVPDRSESATAALNRPHASPHRTRAAAAAAANTPAGLLLLQPPPPPTPRARSLSLSLSAARLTAASPGDGSSEEGGRRTPAHDLDELESVRSYASGTSSASCEHPHVAHNGTTFSGRRMRYVVHCSAHAGQTGEDYLTPTQRAQRQIRRLKHLLHQAKQDIEQKDSDIFRLTKEVVELRLYKAQLHSPEEAGSSSEAVTVRENATEDMKTPDSPTCCTADLTEDHVPAHMHCSYADSGHFDDLLNSSKDSVDSAASPGARCRATVADKACLARLEPTAGDLQAEHRQLVEQYERRLEELVREHGERTGELRQRHQDKLEELLARLAELNVRYGQLLPDYEQARERIHELERQLDEVNARLQEREERLRRAPLERALACSPVPGAAARVSVSDLLHQLQVTQTELDNIKDTEFTSQHSPQAQSLLSAKEAVSLWVLGARKAMYRRLMEAGTAAAATTAAPGQRMDPEVTLQFLKSAIYYFLTDKENHQGHLRAIQSILGFSPQQISNIDRARSS